MKALRLFLFAILLGTCAPKMLLCAGQEASAYFVQTKANLTTDEHGYHGFTNSKAPIELF